MSRPPLGHDRSGPLPLTPAPPPVPEPEEETAPGARQECRHFRRRRRLMTRTQGSCGGYGTQEETVPNVRPVRYFRPRRGRVTSFRGSGGEHRPTPPRRSTRPRTGDPSCAPPRPKSRELAAKEGPPAMLQLTPSFRMRIEERVAHQTTYWALPYTKVGQMELLAVWF